MPVRDLTKLFNPRSIAVVGAAREKNKIGNIILANIQANKFAGDLFPINPHAKHINNLPCFNHYTLLPKIPDLAIVVLPAELVLETVRIIAKHGTRHLVIISAGFKESGKEGAAREAELAKIATEFHLSILGPNCLGFINAPHKLNATFGQTNFPTGNLRLILQSGALATSILDFADGTGLGIQECVTLGNKTVLGENDVLSYWHSKPIQDKKQLTGLSSYHPIGLYLESIEDGQQMIELARTIGRHNPMFLLKPGSSEAAQHAMHSHTGALASNEAVLDEALRECGIIRCEGIEDFFDLSRAFSWENAPRGPHVAIVSNAGGPGVVATDALQKEELVLAHLGYKTHEILQKNLPKAANIHNPIDVLGDALADRYKTALTAVLREQTVDAVLIILTPQVVTQIEETAQIIGKLSKKYHKPIFCSFVGGARISQGEKILNAYRIPSFRFPERAIKALGSMWKWKLFNEEHTKKSNTHRSIISKSQRLSVSNQISQIQLHNTKIIPSFEAQELIRSVGISIPPQDVITSSAAAVHWSHIHSSPVVLKLSSEKLVHKTEFKAVFPHLTTTRDIRTAFDTLTTQQHNLHDPHAQIHIQKHIQNGLEIILGLKRDPQFGSVLLFGIGGIYTELLPQHHLHLTPITEDIAKKLIMQSNVGKILVGYRGQHSYAIPSLAKSMVQLSIFFDSTPQIAELEINPVIITQKEVFAVDTKIILA